MSTCPPETVSDGQGCERSGLSLREEDPADDVCEQADSAEEDEKQPDDAYDCSVDSQILSNAAAYAGDLLV